MAAVVVVVVAVVLLVVFLRGGDHTVRYEVTSQKNSVTRITWGNDSGLHVLRRDALRAESSAPVGAQCVADIEKVLAD